MEEALFDRVAGFYDTEVENLPAISKDIPFYAGYAQECGGEVLELACGTGRVLIPLAEQGIRITGLDASGKMLEQARGKVGRLPADAAQRIQLVHGNMMAFTLDRKFSLIFCAFRSFQLLVTKEERARCLQRVREHLTESGIFIIHLFTPFHHLLAQRSRSIYLGTIRDPETGVHVSRRSEVSYDLAAQVLHEDRFYEWTDKDGRFHRYIWSFDLAYLFRYEVELLLEKHGFKVIDVFGDFDRSPFDYYSGEQIFVARKAG